MFRGIGRAFAHAAKAIARSSIGRAILQIVACATTGPIGCAAAGAALTLAAGGSIKQALIGAAISFVQIGAYSGIHQIIGGIADRALSAAVKVGLHAVVGGAVSVAQGGSFETGALTGAVAAGSSLLMDSSGVMGHSGDGNPEYIAERTAVAAVAGGTASVLSGGKFANGAITGAFAQLYNAEGGGPGMGHNGGPALEGAAGEAATAEGALGYVFRGLGRVFGPLAFLIDMTGPAGGSGDQYSRVEMNRLRGNAFRDAVAAGLEAEGRTVEVEVYKATPFGPRFIDIEVSYQGQVQGGIETKLGSSRYTNLQNLKDWWLRVARGYKVNIVRGK
ncbi:MAG: hypothetical protein R3D51_17885 [Hyphomicrobiaceae bacterium]